jgi:hypothetical protein
MKRLLPGFVVSLLCLASQAVWIDTGPSATGGMHKVYYDFERQLRVH